MMRIAAALLALLTSLPVARADDYPSKPVRIIVGFAAGGATDVLARMLAEGLRKVLGQSFVVENRPGANATIAGEAAAKSAPDGYTLLVTSAGSLTISVHMSPKPNYDTLTSFVPITLLAVNDGVLLANNNFPAKTFPEFVKLLKESPGKYGFGTSGVGSPTHLGAELLKRTVGVNMFHVPYKGDSQALADAIAGHVPLAVVVMASASAQVQSGAVRALAALGPQRFRDFPDLPTVAESGYPGYAAGSWIGLLAPAGTPKEIISKLNEASRKVMTDPEVTGKLVASGSRPSPNSPEEFYRHIESEHKKWGEIIREANIKSE